MKVSNLIKILGMVCVIALLSGCAAVVVGAGAGAGAYAYKAGEMKSVLDASMDNTWKAVEKTVQEMGFVVETKMKDALAAKVEARGANDKKITIKLRSLTSKTTEVRIRVGLFGDELYSQQILQKIRSHI